MDDKDDVMLRDIETIKKSTSSMVMLSEAIGLPGDLPRLWREADDLTDDMLSTARLMVRQKADLKAIIKKLGEESDRIQSKA